MGIKSKKLPETAKCSSLFSTIQIWELTLFTNEDKVHTHDLSKNWEVIEKRLGPVANLFIQSTRDI